jgi:hypothetical protein
MDNEDVDLDWEGLECDILPSISTKVVKNAFEPCAINEVTNLGIFGKKTKFSFSSLSLTLSTIFIFEF